MIQDAVIAILTFFAVNGNSIHVSFVNLHHLFSYFYTETLAGRNDQCPKKFILFFHTMNNCRLLVEINETRLHIRDTDVGVAVTTSNYSSHPDCYTNT